MANHVNSYIEFIRINDEAKAKLQEMGARLQGDSYGQAWFADIFVEGELTEDDVRQYSWTTENIGPKWCHVDDWDFEAETPFMNTQSAWSPPESGLVKLLEILEEIDPKILTTIRYEDEMPNFIGWSFYVGSELEDGCEDDDEEIREGIFHQHPNLKEHWDEENGEWMCDEDGDMTEDAYEAEEEFREVMYEYCSEYTDNGVDDAVKYYLDNEEETQ